MGSQAPGPLSRSWVVYLLVACFVLLLVNIGVMVALLVRRSAPPPAEASPGVGVAGSRPGAHPAAPEPRLDQIIAGGGTRSPSASAARTAHGSGLAAAPDWPIVRPRDLDGEQASREEDDAPCEVDGDCPSGLRCVALACVRVGADPPPLDEWPCSHHADCPPGTRCDQGRRSCRYEGATCASDGDCPSGWFCLHPDRRCMQAEVGHCASDADCPNGVPCTAGACVFGRPLPPRSLGHGGGL